MRKFLLLLALATVSGLGAQAQLGCGNGRYITEVFSNYTLTSDVTYGANINLQGQNQSLEMDIYEPQGDLEPLRPLLVMAHGGSFISGSKNQSDVTDLVKPLTRMGYVCASIEYRLGMEGLPFPGPDSTTATESVVRGFHDMKAAIRFFYKSAQNGNPYRIDTNHIYAGGVSAGAFLALHNAYLDEITEIPNYIDTTQAGLGGGVQGNSGNPGYSDRIAGVINVCGALRDTAYMKAGDEPLVSLHGTADQVVPYGTDMITVVGLFPIFEVDGSHSVHAQAQRLGMNECMFTYQGADHVPHVGNAAYLDTTLNVIKNFMYELVCNGVGQCGYITEVSVPVQTDVKLFPNPAQNQVNLEFPQGTFVQFDVVDMNGRVVRQYQVEGGELLIQRNGLPTGMYLLVGTGSNLSWTGKVIFE